MYLAAAARNGHCPRAACAGSKSIKNRATKRRAGPVLSFRTGLRFEALASDFYIYGARRPGGTCAVCVCPWCELTKCRGVAEARLEEVARLRLGGSGPGLECEGAGMSLLLGVQRVVLDGMG